MRTGSEDAPSLRGARRDCDLLDDDRLFLALDGRRAFDLPGVVCSRPESQHHGYRDGEEPVHEPGDKTPAAEDPGPVGEKEEQTKNPIGQPSKPTKPIRLRTPDPKRPSWGSPYFL